VYNLSAFYVIQWWSGGNLLPNRAKEKAFHLEPSGEAFPLGGWKA